MLRTETRSAPLLGGPPALAADGGRRGSRRSSCDGCSGGYTCGSEIWDSSEAIQAGTGCQDAQHPQFPGAVICGTQDAVLNLDGGADDDAIAPAGELPRRLLPTCRARSGVVISLWRVPSMAEPATTISAAAPATTPSMATTATTCWGSIGRDGRVDARKAKGSVVGDTQLSRPRGVHERRRQLEREGMSSWSGIERSEPAPPAAKQNVVVATTIRPPIPIRDSLHDYERTVHDAQA
jgi:hypothetical protein